jgi:Ca2+-binding EF-hand superfamily protein
MNFSISMMAIPVVALSLTAAASAEAQTMPRETFLVMDIDGNGQVDAVEFGMAMGAAFAHADDNADGMLDAEEVKVLSLPAEVDANGDGQVTITEYLVSVRRDFEGTDRNGDGTLQP